MARLQVADGRSIYYEHHAGTKLPVMLIHGWGMSCRVWDTTLSALKQARHEVITFDQRCCGSSDKDFATTSVTSSAQDAAQLARHLGRERVVFRSEEHTS